MSMKLTHLSSSEILWLFVCLLCGLLLNACGTLNTEPQITPCKPVITYWHNALGTVVKIDTVGYVKTFYCQPKG